MWSTIPLQQGEPNGGTNENCAAFNTGINSYSGQWYDENCSHTKHFICEKNFWTNRFNSSQNYVFLFYSYHHTWQLQNSSLGHLQCIDRTGFTLHLSITIKREESFGLYLQILVLLSNVWKICWVESNQCYSADEKSEGERTNNQYFFLFQILILLVFVFLFAQDLLYVSSCSTPDFDLLYFSKTVIGC